MYDFARLVLDNAYTLNIAQDNAFQCLSLGYHQQRSLKRQLKVIFGDGEAAKRRVWRVEDADFGHPESRVKLILERLSWEDIINLRRDNKKEFGRSLDNFDRKGSKGIESHWSFIYDKLPSKRIARFEQNRLEKILSHKTIRLISATGLFGPSVYKFAIDQNLLPNSCSLVAPIVDYLDYSMTTLSLCASVLGNYYDWSGKQRFISIFKMALKM
jgi:hypothetical protein